MPAIKLEYAPGVLGPIKIKGEGNPSEPAPLVEVALVGQANVKVDVGTPAGQPTLGVDAILHGSPNPLQAQVTTPPGQPVTATVEATVSGGAPVTAVLNGGIDPLTAYVTATVPAPVKVDVGVGDIGFRNARVKFKLFGLFTILTMEVGP